MKKLPDEIAACNIINYNRLYNRKLKRKALSIPIKLDDKNKIRSETIVCYNPSSKGVDVSSHALVCKNIHFYPTTNLKLTCTNPHAMDMLRKARKPRGKRK